VYEEKLIHSTPKSVLFGAVVTDSLEQAADWEARLQKLPAVAGVESLSRFLREDSAHKLELVRQIKETLRPSGFPRPTRSLWTSRS